MAKERSTRMNPAVNDAAVCEHHHDCFNEVYAAMFPRWVAVMLLSAMGMIGTGYGIFLWNTTATQVAVQQAQVRKNETELTKFATHMEYVRLSQKKIESDIERIREMMEKKTP